MLSNDSIRAMNALNERMCMTLCLTACMYVRMYVCMYDVIQVFHDFAEFSRFRNGSQS